MQDPKLTLTQCTFLRKLKDKYCNVGGIFIRHDKGHGFDLNFKKVIKKMIWKTFLNPGQMINLLFLRKLVK